ncbi:hypothetical protein L6452_25947 [Arctium lappa]|uniref:Uncharacterized protein n=1 Tax=Arctium lappa TaxID=4217 RepID=A0ACB9ABF6_ARCLA|nr:hypothetical protein L6452_25947 [Arctium lappa]
MEGAKEGPMTIEQPVKSQDTPFVASVVNAIRTYNKPRRGPLISNSQTENRFSPLASSESSNNDTEKAKEENQSREEQHRSERPPTDVLELDRSSSSGGFDATASVRDVLLQLQGSWPSLWLHSIRDLHLCNSKHKASGKHDLKILKKIKNHKDETMVDTGIQQDVELQQAVEDNKRDTKQSEDRITDKWQDAMKTDVKTAFLKREFLARTYTSFKASNLKVQVTKVHLWTRTLIS